jgi:hypothetical protein
MPSLRWPPSASAAFRRIKLDEHLPESQTGAYLKSFHTHGVLLTSARRLRLTQAEKLSAYRLLMGISVHLGSSRIVHSRRRSHSNHESAMSSATICEPQPTRSEPIAMTSMFLPMVPYTRPTLDLVTRHTANSSRTPRCRRGHAPPPSAFCEVLNVAWQISSAACRLRPVTRCAARHSA